MAAPFVDDDAALDDASPTDLADLILSKLDVGDLKALPEVKEVIDDPDVEVRADVREDLVAAALDAPTEAQREASATRVAELENSSAPSADDLAKLAAPPHIEVTLSDDQSFVEAVHITKWVAHPETGVPVQVEFDPEEFFGAPPAPGGG
jgi:hypothetical protein